jgi:hypothetical protein
MKSSIPKNCRGALYALVTWSPFTFSHPLGPVLSLHVHVPLPVPYRPPAKGPVCSGRDLPSRWTAVGHSTLQSWVPHSLSTAIYGPFRVLSTCICRAQGCCFRRWRGRPFWWASQCSACCHPPPRSSPCGPWLPSLRPRPDCCVPGPPHVILCMKAVRIKSFQAAEPGTCLLQLLTVYWLQGQIKTDKRVFLS